MQNQSPLESVAVECALRNSSETSILPFEDCCTIFVAKHPVTKPNVNVIRGHEQNLEDVIDELVQTALDTREIIEIK
mgnify:CR=1 FL=1